MPEAASVLIGPAEIALTRIFEGRDRRRDTARSIPAQLCDAHDVVVRHPLLGAVIGQRQQRAAIRHQLLGTLGDRREGVAGDQQRLGEVRLAGLDIAARQLVLIGEGDAVDDEVELAPELLDLGEDRVDRRAVGDVAMADDMAAKLLGKRLDPLLQRIALIGEGEFRSRIRRRLGDAPGDGPVVRDAHHEPALALEEIGGRRNGVESGMETRR